MKDIEFDLENIKTILKEKFDDPFSANELTEFLTSNSKFIRSKLALLFLKTQNCAINQITYNILAIGEIIHNSSLLHDDVLDDAETRRGKPTISKTFGNKISILAGDYLLAFAIEKLLEIDNKNITESFKNCTKSMCKAEIYQLLNRGKLITKEEYISICKGKTANLFSTIFESCAIIHNLDIHKSKLFGELFGICFQIRNDLEPNSSLIDKQNQIYTAIDILGIEKTKDLLDNYKEEMQGILSEFSDNVYRQSLKDLIKEL